jgi:hypothetical protein
MPKFRAKQAVIKLLDDSTEPLDTAEKVASLTSLTVFSYLDQKNRSKRQPTRPSAKRVISTKHAKRARLLTFARIVDRSRRLDRGPLLRRVFKIGGLSSIAEGPSTDELIAAFQASEKEVRYVVQIVDYLVRSRAFPAHHFPSTIENAKAFTCKWIDEFGPSKISHLWEDFKLVAPYLYALSLERSFQPLTVCDIDDVLDWAFWFVQSSRRIARFLGHAGYAMDVLKEIARDQRQSDFDTVHRIAPPLRPFNDEERLVISNLGRNAAIACAADALQRPR